MTAKTTIRKLALPATLAVGIGAGATLVEAWRDPLPDLQAQDAGRAAPVAPNPDAASLATAFRQASAAAMPAVVHVRTEQAGRLVSQQVPPGFRGTPFEEMFRGQTRVPPTAGSGSGFILSADGHIVTNNHVVADASRVTVVLADRREFEARVVGRDPDTDIAVLKVEASGLPVARIGDADQLQTGDWVLALGYPLSLGQTTTAGIVSAKGRSIGIMARNEGAENPLEHFIQTDAAINPGNSGGPLVDLQGRVVGVNSAIASPTGFYSGYGFAVPVNLAARVADDLIRHGAVRRPIVGVQIRDAGTADAEVFRLPSPAGAVVAGEPSGGARDAGMRLGDVVVAVDGRPINDSGDLRELVMRKRPGDEVTLDVIRYGERRRFTVELSAATPAAPLARPADAAAAPADDAAGRLGFQAQEMSAQEAQRAGIRAGRGGVVVVGTDPLSPAAEALPRGLILETLNGRDIRSLADLRAAAADIRPGGVVSIIGRLPDTGSQTIVNYRARS